MPYVRTRGNQLAIVHGEREPVENFTVIDTNLQVFDFKQCHHFFPRRHPEAPCAAISKDG